MNVDSLFHLCWFLKSRRTHGTERETMGDPSTSLRCLQRKATLRKQRGLFRFGTDICNKSASPLLWRTWKKASELYSSPGEIPQCQEVAPEAEDMCIICERELWGEHRALEREFFKSCKTCKKFP